MEKVVYELLMNGERFKDTQTRFALQLNQDLKVQLKKIEEMLIDIAKDVRQSNKVLVKTLEQIQKEQKEQTRNNKYLLSISKEIERELKPSSRQLPAGWDSTISAFSNFAELGIKVLEFVSPFKKVSLMKSMIIPTN